ncbi:hypothetical protein ABZS71_30020 [Streptomyces sp. NPDC005393]|uniref:hypothetical protein n=1 Tax=Streptomyces sp. NPDC005393 TaxID=3157041 RepID=UPI0033A9ADCF
MSTVNGQAAEGSTCHMFFTPPSATAYWIAADGAVSQMILVIYAMWCTASSGRASLTVRSNGRASSIPLPDQQIGAP